ncbi:hypothetical protein D9M73_200120 [compost metagenome]
MRSRQRTRDTCQAKQADLGMAQRQRRSTERHDHGTPQHAECGEDQHTEHAALAQQPVVPIQAELSHDQRPVTRPTPHRLPAGQTAPQHQRQHHQEPCGDQVHTSPTGQVSEPARSQPCQQNTQHHTTGDGAYRLPLLAR